MKTAISIPDRLFAAADQYAKNHGFSRSKLYAKAMEQYLDQHPADYITSELNKIYQNDNSKLDPVTSSLQSHSIEQDKW